MEYATTKDYFDELIKLSKKDQLAKEKSHKNKKKKKERKKQQKKEEEVTNYDYDIKSTDLSHKKLNSDSFPYTNRISDYFETGGTWTGYFSTRPWHKRRMQEIGRILRNLKEALTPMLINNHITGDAYKDLRQAVWNGDWWTGVFTHHDAITPTSRERVMQDYMMHLDKKFLDVSNRTWNRHQPVRIVAHPPKKRYGQF